MSYIEDDNNGNRVIPTDSISTMEILPQKTKTRSVKSIMSEYINEQLPQANSFIFNVLIGAIQVEGQLPEKSKSNDPIQDEKVQKFYDQYKDMINDKAEAMIKDVMGAILKLEKKWDNSYKQLNSKDLYKKLTEVDQNRFKELFQKTEEWREKTFALFDDGNDAALQEQLNIKIKKELAKNTGILYTSFGTAEAVSSSRRMSEELYRNVFIPDSAGYVVLKSSNKKDAKVLMLYDNQVVKDLINQAMIDIYNPEVRVEDISIRGRMLDIIEKSPEKHYIFAEKVNTIVAAYNVVGNAIKEIDSKYHKKISQENFYQILKSVIPTMLGYSANYINNNSFNFAHQLANDLIKNNSTVFVNNNTLNIGPKSIKRITKNMSEYVANVGTAALRRSSLDSGISSSSDVSDKSFSRSSSVDSIINDKKVLPTFIQPFVASDNVLEHLMHKYDELLLQSNSANLSFEEKKQNLYTLNAELFGLTSSEAQILPINKLSLPPTKTFIQEIENAFNITYSNIGADSNNILVMAETDNGKIYFDEKENNRFTGVIFVERIDENTGQLLGAKDIIYYKNGEVIKFIDGIEGKSRLGQIEQFKQANKVLYKYNNNTEKAPTQIVEQIVKEAFFNTKEKLSSDNIVKITDGLLDAKVDYSDRNALRNKISNSYDIIQKSLYNIETIRGKRISSIVMQDSLKKLLPVFTQIDSQYLTQNSENLVSQLTQQLYQNRNIFSTAIGSGFKINSKKLEDVAQSIISSYDKHMNLVNIENVNRESISKQQFKVSVDGELSEKEKKYILKSVEQNRSIIGDNILGIIKNHGNYNMFIEGLGEIIKNNDKYKQKDVLSEGELKILNLNDAKQKELFDNTLKVVRNNDPKVLADVVSRSLNNIQDQQLQKSNNTYNRDLNPFPVLQNPEKPIVLEKPVINLPPKMSKISSVSSQEPRNTGMMFKKRYMLPITDSADMSQAARPVVEPKVSEPKLNVTGAPTLSTFKPDITQQKQSDDSEYKLLNLATALNNRNHIQDVTLEDIKDLKTPEEVRNYIKSEELKEELQDKEKISKMKQENIEKQNLEVISEPLITNGKNEYPIKDMQLLADEIIKKALFEANIKSKAEITKLQDFLKSELNEYINNKEKDNLSNIMDMMYLPEMLGRKENFQNFMANTLVHNQAKLKDGILVEKMELFYNNIYKDCIGKQENKQFNPDAPKTLSEKEMSYILDNLDNQLLTDNVVNIIKDYSNHSVFIREVTKIMQKENITPKKYNDILSTKELKLIDLKDPNQVDLLKNTINVINKYDSKLLRNAIKLSVIKKQVQEINQNIDPNIVPSSPKSLGKNNYRRE
ncbi:MAG: hypothetical protein AB8U25_03230 [Rickettsiales endosymbiont of Dermacentor nuttalli]